MSEYISFAESVITTILAGSVVGYVISKLTMSHMESYIAEQKLELKQLAEEWLNSDKGKQAILQIGALIGNGAKIGIGIAPARGKGGLIGLVTDIAGQYFKSKLGIPEQQQQQQESTIGLG